MTKAEQEAFEKWMVMMFGEGWSKWMNPLSATIQKEAFLAGYRAGFEAQHYDIEDVNKEKVE